MTIGILVISSFDISESILERTCRVVGILMISNPFFVEKILHLFEFEKLRAIRASLGGVGGVDDVVVWVTC